MAVNDRVRSVATVLGYAVGFALGWGVIAGLLAIVIPWGGAASPLLKGVIFGATFGLFGGSLFGMSQPGVVTAQTTWVVQIVSVLVLVILLLVGVVAGGFADLGFDLGRGATGTVVWATLAWGAIHAAVGWGIRWLRGRR